jgi:hypothetical protein
MRKDDSIKAVRAPVGDEPDGKPLSKGRENHRVIFLRISQGM